LTGTAGFGDLDDGGEASQPAAYDDDPWCCCHVFFLLQRKSEFGADAGMTRRQGPEQKMTAIMITESRPPPSAR
jgi:hypothetical protein